MSQDPNKPKPTKSAKGSGKPPKTNKKAPKVSGTGLEGVAGGTFRNGPKKPGTGPEGVAAGRKPKNARAGADKALATIASSDSRAGRAAQRAQQAKAAAAKVKGAKAATTAATAAGTGGTSLAAQAAQEIGTRVAAQVANKAKQFAPIVGVIVVFSLIVGLVMFSGGGSNNQTGGLGRAPQSEEVISENILKAYQAAGLSYNVPWTVIAAIGTLATENGKFSPYDKFDRDPSREGIRRPSSGAGSNDAADEDSAPAAIPAETVLVIGKDCATGGPLETTIATLSGSEDPSWEVSASCETRYVIDPVVVEEDEPATEETEETEETDEAGVDVSLGESALGLVEAVKSNGATVVIVNAGPADVNASEQEWAAALELFANETSPARIVFVPSGAAPGWFVDAARSAADASSSFELSTATNAVAEAKSYVVDGAGTTAQWPDNPEDLETRAWPSIEPPIGGEPGEGVGPFLIEPWAVDIEGFDPQDLSFTGPGAPTTATEFIANKLHTIRDEMLGDGWEYSDDDLEIHETFWVEAIRRLPIVDPRSSDCQPLPAGPGGGEVDAKRQLVSQNIQHLWSCTIAGSDGFTTLTSASVTAGGTYADQITGTAASGLLVREAMDVAWAFSQWGHPTDETVCDASVDLAGVFPLTQAVFEEYRPAWAAGSDRCNESANIAAAAAAVLSGEEVQPGTSEVASRSIGDRSTATGVNNPMIGGWWAMPWALGDAAHLTDFLDGETATGWSPSPACQAAIVDWALGLMGGPILSEGEDVGAAAERLSASLPSNQCPRASTSQLRVEAAAMVRTLTLDPNMADMAGRLQELSDVIADGAYVGALVGGVHSSVERLSSTASAATAAPTTSTAAIPSDYGSKIIELAIAIGGILPSDPRFDDEAEDNPFDLVKDFAAQLGGGFALLGSSIPYAQAFNDAGALFDLDPRMIAAVAKTESGFRPDIIDCSTLSRVGAKGIMQFMPSVAAGYGIDPCNPEEAIPAGAELLRGHYDKYQNWEMVFAAYNWGPGNVDRKGMAARPKETIDHTAKTMATWEEYKTLFPDSVISIGWNGEGRIDASPNGPICIATVLSAIGTNVEVKCDIAGNVQALFDLAKSEGMSLDAWAYRSSQRQIELRSINGCPDVWTASPSRCRVPTAIPGTSRHESGVALDFKNCGSRSTSCYSWLVRNANTFGLYNLPSESWHWSIDGR